ncbi:hypothetical protein GCM10010502_16520 [Kitasatospora aureofaciens]|uniref:Uncharacterized protein n=1 Tax=Kitasatospora aureofaciens TaxID=1894 RepID=A0A8H9LKC4_KITAU|nr:hypothetical protein CP971_16400 [Streptomyces viridifaciens]GGU66225.1 hypothetical protein GCM10010502_16520 [Kitasatospora aureofaciens]
MCIIGRKGSLAPGRPFALETHLDSSARSFRPEPRLLSPPTQEGRGPAVKKLLLVALVALGGFFVYRQVQADRAEQDLWTEATDPVPAGR